MTLTGRFLAAAPYQDDVLALPVIDLDAAAAWYAEKFGMSEVERSLAPVPRIVLERDGVQLGFAINGGDPAEAGAEIRVEDIAAVRADLEARGTPTANWRIDEHDGRRMQVFFVVAPDGLCFYFTEPVAESGEPDRTA